MIINLIREPSKLTSMVACHAEAPGVPAHRVAAFPFEDAEREVRRRVLRSLADRANPPTAVVFVRTWEHQFAGGVPSGQNRDGNCVPGLQVGTPSVLGHPAQQMAIDAFRAEQAVAVAAFPEDAGVSEVPVSVPVSAEQVAAPPRRGRKARPAP